MRRQVEFSVVVTRIKQDIYFWDVVRDHIPLRRGEGDSYEDAADQALTALREVMWNPPE